MNEYPNFEQNFFQEQLKVYYKIGHDSFKLLTWLAYYDRSFSENIYYFN